MKTKIICIISATTFLSLYVNSSALADSYIECKDQSGEPLDTWHGTASIIKISPNPDAPSMQLWFSNSLKYDDELCGFTQDSDLHGYTEVKNVCSYSQAEYRMRTEYVRMGSQSYRGATIYNSMLGTDLIIDRVTGRFELKREFLDGPNRKLNHKQSGFCVPVGNPEFDLPKPIL